MGTLVQYEEQLKMLPDGQLESMRHWVVPQMHKAPIDPNVKIDETIAVGERVYPVRLWRENYTGKLVHVVFMGAIANQIIDLQNEKIKLLESELKALRPG